DPGMMRGHQLFRWIEQLFVDLFALPEPDESYGDLLSRRVAGEADELLGDLQYPDRLTHIEYKHFPTLPHDTGFDHQTACFGNGHKVPRDLWVGNSYRSAIEDLADKQRNYGARGAQHVPKTGGDEPGIARQPRQRLDIDLRDALCRAHDSGRIDGFVAGDQDEFADTGANRRVRHVLCASYVCEDGLTRQGLHDGYMFISSGVEDKIGPIVVEDSLDALFIPYRSHFHAYFDRQVKATQLELKIEKARFALVEQDDAA